MSVNCNVDAALANFCVVSYTTAGNACRIQNSGRESRQHDYQSKNSEEVFSLSETIQISILTFILPYSF